MPPKRNCKSSQQTETDPSSSDDTPNMAFVSTDMEQFFDKRMKQKSNYINDLFVKYTKVTKDDLEEVKKSQNVLNEKFENLMTSVKELNADNKFLRSENARLQIIPWGTQVNFRVPIWFQIETVD